MKRLWWLARTPAFWRNHRGGLTGTPVLLSCLMVLVIPISLAWGYEAVDVGNGGSIHGKVKAVSMIPPDPTIQVTKDQDHCGATLPREKYVVSDNKEIRYVVAYIEGIPKGKKIPGEPVIVDNKMCAFHPHVQTAAIGQDVIVDNSDPMLHNTHLYMNTRTLYNFALPMQGMKIKKPLNRVGLIEIHCDAHTWMTGYLYVNDNPYAATTDEHGEFVIRDVPPGTYKLKVWHEALGQREKSVTVTSGKTTEITFEF